MPQPLAPISDDFSAWYWTAARGGKLLVQRCRRCSLYQFYPRQHCVGCFAPDPEWVTSSGRGVLYSFTTVHRTPNQPFAELTPYILALVDLEEGVRISVNLVDATGEQLRCGDRVSVVFRQISEDVTLPCAVAHRDPERQHP